MDRFWSKVDMPGHFCCWPWMGNRHRQGYGLFKIGNTNRLAHRVSLMLCSDIILKPEDKVLHICDNPPCVNFRHLEVGTQQDNCVDMALKGRHRGSRIINEDQVRAIRRDRRPDEIVAVEYGLAPNTVYGIRSGRSWKSVI